MARLESHPERSFFKRHPVLSSALIAGCIGIARNIYKYAPLTITVDAEGVRRIVIDPTLREQFANYAQGIYSPPMADDSHRMTFAEQPDINAGRVRQNSETNPTATTAKVGKVSIEKVPDPDKERLVTSSSLFPDGLQTHLREVDAFLERTKDV